MTGRPEDALVERLQSVQFKPVRFREGYSLDDVDALLDRMVEAVRNGGPLRPVREMAMLTRVRFREGYDIAEVDAFLDSVTGASGNPATGGAV